MYFWSVQGIGGSKWYAGCRRLQPVTTESLDQPMLDGFRDLHAGPVG
jgi:hypothetical protein